jgi:hypothetical protein
MGKIDMRKFYLTIGYILWTGLLIAALIGCAGGKSFDYQPTAGEMKPGPGALTGESGELTVVRSPESPGNSRFMIPKKVGYSPKKATPKLNLLPQPQRRPARVRRAQPQKPGISRNSRSFRNGKKKNRNFTSIKSGKNQHEYQEWKKSAQGSADFQEFQEYLEWKKTAKGSGDLQEFQQWKEWKSYQEWKKKQGQQ